MQSALGLWARVADARRVSGPDDAHTLTNRAGNAVIRNRIVSWWTNGVFSSGMNASVTGLTVSTQSPPAMALRKQASTRWAPERSSFRITLRATVQTTLIGGPAPSWAGILTPHPVNSSRTQFRGGILNFKLRQPGGNETAQKAGQIFRGRLEALHLPRSNE